MTRSELLARLMRSGSTYPGGRLRRDIGTLDALFGNAWRRGLEDLAELRILRFWFVDGDVKIYIRKQITGRTR